MIHLCVLLLLAVSSTAWSADPAAALNAEVEFLYAEKRYADAEVPARELLALDRSAENLGQVALLLRKQRDYTAAQPFYDEVVATIRATPGDNRVGLANALMSLATCLHRQGNYPPAKPLFEESLNLLVDALGEEHVEVGTAANNLASLLKAQGDNAGAQRQFERAIAIWRAARGEDDPGVATGLNNLATVLQARGDLDGARAMFEQSLASRRARDPTHPGVALSLNNLGSLVRAQGEYAEALTLYEESLEIYRNAYGNDHHRVALLLNNVAMTHKELGDMGKARRLLEESLAIRRRVRGPDHLEVATVLNNLGLLGRTEGDYAAARPLLEESLAIWRTALGDEHPKVAMGLSNLATLLHSQGDHAGARPLYEESLAIRRAALEEGHHALAYSLNNVASVLVDLGDPAAALPLFEESLAIVRAAFGDEHPRVATALHNFANLLNGLGDAETALRMYDESLVIRRKVHGDAHLDVADSLRLQGKIHHRQGDLATAQSLLEQCLKIRREILGDEHIKVAYNLNLLASLLEDRGEPQQARDLRVESLAIIEGRLSLLDVLSEREALAYLPQLRGILDGWLSAFSDPEYDTEAWTHVLQFKGSVAARLKAARVATHANAQVASTAADLARVRGDLARLSLSTELEDRRARLDALSAERDRLERELLQQSASHGAPSAEDGPAEICAALPDGTSLVDLFRYQRSGEAHYVAFTLTSGTCKVHRTELGLAARLDEAVAEWRAVLEDPAASSTRIDDRGARVADRLWAPLAPRVGDARHLLVVPDGPLASAPLAALPVGDGRYLLEDRAITWIDHARDVRHTERGVSRGALVIGDVDYDAAATDEADSRAALAPCNDRGFEPLPGAAEEARAVADRWARRHREPLLTLGGADATEAAVTEALRGKALVHFATHGFFATERCRSALEGDGTIGFDPMVLSGLVLAGANRQLDPLAPEDGILTAAEVAALDLSGTGLVVLSACRTGLGEVRSGEGVLGLRRAFRIAGARTLVMTLWSVSDDQTASLMDEVYRLHLRRRKPMGAAAALRTAQLEVLEAQRDGGVVHPGVWAGFVSAGDWR